MKNKKDHQITNPIRSTLPIKIQTQEKIRVYGLKYMLKMKRQINMSDVDPLQWVEKVVT